MKSSFSQPKFLLVLIFFLGLIFRIAWINSSPPSLYGDELTIALDANSLLHTGKDQLGNNFPLTFQMGAGRPAGYVYGSIPFIGIFGTTPLGVRFLSLLSGLGIIILIFYLCKQFFDDKVALAAAFVTSVSPWDISLSRGGFEAHFALFLALLGVYLFVKAKGKPSFYIFSALSFGLTLHTYPTYKLSLIFFLPLLLWFEGMGKSLGSRKYFFAGAVLVLMLGLIAVSQTFIGGSEKRFLGINIFSQDKLKNAIEQKINLERKITSLPPNPAKYFHNKPVEYTKVFIENYLQNYSLDFLVIHGDRNPRHNMVTMGEVFFAEMLLIILGFLTFRHTSRKLFIFLTLWLIIAPISTAMIDLPHALRSSFMLPPLIIFAGVGFAKILNSKRTYLKVGLAAVFIVQFLFFIQKLYFLAPQEYSNFWSYSAKLASELAIQNKEKYKYVFLSDNIDSIEFAYPVYAKIAPSLVIYQNKHKTKLANSDLKKFENVYIGKISAEDIHNLASNLNEPILYIGGLTDKLQNFETINGIDGLPGLVISRTH